MKFIHKAWGLGGLTRWGINYSKEERRYALILPYWFPFYGRWSEIRNYEFREFLSLVIPVIGIAWFRHSFHVAIWRWELKRETPLVSTSDLISFLSFHISNLPNSRSLKKATETIGDLRKRGLSPEKIEFLLRK